MRSFFVLVVVLFCLSTISLASSQCSKDKKTLVGHEAERDVAAGCLFEAFGKPVLTKKHLDCMWPGLPAIFRRQAGDDPQNIMDRCDLNPTDGTFSKAKILALECSCVENIVRVNQMNVLCHFLVNNKTLLQQCRDADL